MMSTGMTVFCLCFFILILIGSIARVIYIEFFRKYEYEESVAWIMMGMIDLVAIIIAITELLS